MPFAGREIVPWRVFKGFAKTTDRKESKRIRTNAIVLEETECRGLKDVLGCSS